MKKLTEVESFGGIDADADDLLDECFQDHEAYIKARDHKRFLIIGRKGSGKTAIFKKIITTRKYDTFTFGHTFADYPWHHHDAQATIGVPEEDRYTHSWKYLILLSASKILLNQDQSQPWCQDMMPDIIRLESFLVDSYGSRDPDITQLFTPEKTLRINPTLGIPGTSLGATIERIPVNQLPKVIQDVNRTVTNSVIRSLNPKFHYYVCFDQLDLGFDTSNPEYAQRLTGLILAARDISQRAKDEGKRLSVTIFLRDDIYQILRFEDKNKLSENYMSRIEWDSPRTEWTLKSLMEKRFAKVLGTQPTNCWDKVFDETQEMRGRQKKYLHIRDRTFRRPRDIIKFCNEVLAAYKERGGDPDGKFKNPDIIKARDKYSEYLLNELDDELFKHIPEYRNYLEIWKTIGTLQFTSNQFLSECKRRTDLFPNRVAPETVLKLLYEFSIIGYLKAGGGGGGSQYVWRYLDPSSRFDEASPNFRVHPGFKEVLGLKEGGKPSTAD